MTIMPTVGSSSSSSGWVDSFALGVDWVEFPLLVDLGSLATRPVRSGEIRKLSTENGMSTGHGTLSQSISSGHESSFCSVDESELDGRSSSVSKTVSFKSGSVSEGFVGDDGSEEHALPEASAMERPMILMGTPIFCLAHSCRSRYSRSCSQAGHVPAQSPLCVQWIGE